MSEERPTIQNLFAPNLSYSSRDLPTPTPPTPAPPPPIRTLKKKFSDSFLKTKKVVVERVVKGAEKLKRVVEKVIGVSRRPLLNLSFDSDQPLVPLPLLLFLLLLFLLLLFLPL